MSEIIDLRRRKTELFDIYIHNVTFDEAVKVLIKCFLPGNGKSRYVVTPNSTQIVQVRGNKHLKEIYNQADLVIADGMPVIWGSRLLGSPLKERVTGADLLPRLCTEAANLGYKVFFLGANPGVAKEAAHKLKTRHPKLQVAGVYSPPFGFEDCHEENAKIIQLIKDSQPDILFVALGFPKQEIWIHRYAPKCNVPVSIGVGAAFDFVAGTLARAPRWMQRWGLEWLYRLWQEPGRLWHRYLILGPQFIWLSLKEILKAKIKGTSRKTQ